MVSEPGLHRAVGKFPRPADKENIAWIRGLASRWADAKDKANRAHWDYRRELRKQKPQRTSLDRLYAAWQRARVAQVAAATLTNKMALRAWGRT